MTSCNGKLCKLSLNGSLLRLSEANFVIRNSLRGNGEPGLVGCGWVWPLWEWPVGGGRLESSWCCHPVNQRGWDIHQSHSQLEKHKDNQTVSKGHTYDPQRSKQAEGSKIFLIIQWTFYILFQNIYSFIICILRGPYSPLNNALFI